jgi:ABC-type nickel/cobalt efflux system permease component RcnA
MFGLDEQIAELGGGGLLVAALVALLLGLRHATDPDHIAAVSTLTLSDEEHGARRAGLLALSWGAGHAVALFAFGLPIVLFDSYLPDPVQTGAEVLLALVIAVLAVRLLVRWRRGHFHGHVHSHGGLIHSHPHLHEKGDHPEGHPHEHAHEESLGRTPRAAFGIGLLHGAGGSAGVGVLLVAAIPGAAQGLLGLALLAGGTAISMALVTAGFGHVLACEPVGRRLDTVAPVFGVLSLLFAVWYGLGSLDAVPYVS